MVPWLGGAVVGSGCPVVLRLRAWELPVLRAAQFSGCDVQRQSSLELREGGFGILELHENRAADGVVHR